MLSMSQVRRTLIPVGSSDPYLLVTTLILLSFGLVMVASASVGFADSVYVDSWYFVKRHISYLCLGSAAACVVLLTPSYFWREYGWIFMLLALGVLILVLIPGVGRRVNGSQRWLALGPINIQASEIAKFCSLVFFARYLSRWNPVEQSAWQDILKPIGFLALLLVLCLLEPDFGSTVVLSVTVVAMLFLAGVKLWQFALLALAGLASLSLVALISPYRVQRLITFLDPWADQYNSGYQLVQSLIAFGRGEWSGVGLGNSVQKLSYLPEAHTDFIFAIVAEEFGFIGVVMVMAIYATLIWRILRVSYRSLLREDRFATLLCFGVAVMFSLQVFINIGVASGLLPTKGLTLPFVSYGGSSLVICLMVLSLVLRIDWELCAKERGNA